MFTKSITVQKHIAIGVMVIALFFGTMLGVAKAQTTSIGDLQALILQLTEQINTLSNKGMSTGGASKPSAGTTTTATSDCNVGFSRTLGLGARDAETSGDVTRLQNYLASTGHFTYGKPTGYYGPATAQAVQRWQAENGIVKSGTPDTTGYGVFGPSTRAKFLTKCTPGGSVSTQPIVSGTPALTITAPQAGVDYEPGDSVTLKWNSKNLKGYTAAVILKSNAATGAERYLARGVDLSRGSIRVQIPVSDSLGTVIPGSYQLTLAVLNVKDGSPQDVRDSVRINIIEEEEIEEIAEITVVEEDTSAIALNGGKSGEFKITYTVTAGEEDIYLPNAPGYFGRPMTDENFVNFTLMKNGVVIDGYKLESSYTVDITTTATNLGNVVGYINNVPATTRLYLIEAGETEEFTLTVVFTPIDTAAANYRMHLEGPLHYSLDRQLNDGDDVDVSFKEFATPSVSLGSGTSAVTCINNGVSYPERTTRTSLTNADGSTRTIMDAYFVCRSGEWKIEGSLPGVTTPTPTTSCLSGSTSYPEGTKRTNITLADGTSKSIMDAYFVCRSGEWKIESGFGTGSGTTTTSPNFTSSVSGLTATLKFSIANACAGYTLQWGDGIRTTRTAAAAGTMCTQAIVNLEKPHTYAQAGTYPVTLTRFSGSTQTDTYTKNITVAALTSTGFGTGSVRGAATTNIQEAIKEAIATVEAMIADMQ